MDVSPSFVVEHSTAAAWLLSICALAAASAGGWAFHKVVQIYNLAWHCFTNCLPTTQENTGKTREAVEALASSINAQNAQMGVLISLIEKKL